MNDSWHSYPKVYAIGHPAITALFEGPVVVEEKVDGSQLSFGLFDGDLKLRSQGRVFSVHDAGNLFNAAVATVLELRDVLHDGWTYRGEYLRKPRHNALAYERTPQKNIILFDINTGNESYLDSPALSEEAKRIGLESVPVMHRGELKSIDEVLVLLERPSVLGGPIEGVVVKNHQRFGRNGKALMGKYVQERFKERNDKSFRSLNPSKSDIIDQLCEAYHVEPRWEKAVQHLRDIGELERAPQDIARLTREVHRDIDEECSDEIKDALYKWASKKIKRAAVRGMPEWYKKKLIESQFEGSES